jgi:hypothetical protein
MKPVAWMWENDAWMGAYSFSKEKPSAYPNAIPLYTAPRELSDEEIDDIWAGISTGDDCVDMHEFARAILKKASEK